MNLHLTCSVAVLFFIFVTVNGQYEVGEVRVEAIKPRGLRVSIEDEDGISLFAFHGKINQEMNGREAGTFSVDITKVKNGRWTYFTKGPKLKPGDVVYYWVNVDFDDGNGKRGYIKDDQSFTVKELVFENTTTSSSTITTTSTTSTARPTPTRTKVPPIDNIPGCKPSPTIVAGKQKCKGDLIFEETFGHLLERQWTPEIRFALDPDYEFVTYQASKDNLYVEKNKLHIKPSIVEDKFGKGYVYQPLDLGERCTGVPGTVECVQKPRAWAILPPVFSAQVSTKNFFSFTYGVIEIQARLPKGDWIYPELYLKPKNDEYGPGIESGLIRIAHSPGNEKYNHELQGGCVLGHSVAARNYAVKSIMSEKKWNNATHTFRLDWKTDSITLSVNQQVYGNIYPPEEGFAAEDQLEISQTVADRWKNGSPLAPFDKEMYIVLGVGVGGQVFPNEGDDGKPWDNGDPKRQLNFYKAIDTWRKTWSQDSKLLVESVKVWAL